MVVNREYFRDKIELHIGGIGDEKRLLAKMKEGNIIDFCAL